MFSWLFPFPSFKWLLTDIGIALFVGLREYDPQPLKQIANSRKCLAGGIKNRQPVFLPLR
jgi:hypothetical protein